MYGKTLFFIVILSLFVLFPAISQDSSTDETVPAAERSKYATSLYLRYNLTRPDYAKTPYYIGFDAGADMDFGGDVPVLNLAGVGFSGKYIFLNNKNDITDEKSESHYLSTGLSFYLKTRLEKPLNLGLRGGVGSGWMVAGEIDEQTDNNKRLNGIYFDVGFFTEIKLSERYYIETGVDARKQHYYQKETEIDPVDMGFIYFKAGIKL